MNREKKSVTFIPWEILFLPLFFAFAMLSGFLKIETQTSLAIVTGLTAWFVFGFWFWLRKHEFRTVFVRRCQDVDKLNIDRIPSLRPLRPLLRFIIISAIGVSVGWLIALFSLKDPVSLAVLVSAYTTGGFLFGADLLASRRLYFKASHATDSIERFHSACLAIALRPSKEDQSGLNDTEEI